MDALRSLKVPTFDRLVQEFQKLPSVGRRSAERMALWVLKSPKAQAEALGQALIDAKDKISFCVQCFAYTEEEDLCAFCSDQSRDFKKICVVTQPSDIGKIESSGVFKGQYHVLHGLIAPLDGVGPSDIKIYELKRRVQDKPEIDFEIILALSTDIEGDTTSLYMSQEFENINAKISKLAQGVPMGGALEFLDGRTLALAIEQRQEI